MQKWNEAFKREGKIFTEVQEDIPKISDFFKKHGVRRILDLGFGSGRHTVYLAAKGFEVQGIDIAQEGLRLTRSWLEEKALKADLRIGNIYDRLPYPDDFFDAIVSVQVMHHSVIANIRKLIKEVERVLRPSGLLFVTVLKSSQRTHKKIAPSTVVPTGGPDKGLIHYLFNKASLRKEFSNFIIERIWVDSTNHYCFLGRLKRHVTVGEEP
ncbi:MAG: class I SAM-dependent methyltransferase [Promethearchaeati archaeon SRVP18_Atabeyarchaeia-1]